MCTAKEQDIRPGDLLRLAWAGLQSSRTRTFLTVLGVIVGTACITLMLCIGWSGLRELSSRIAASGSLTLIEVQPDPARSQEITEAAVAAFASLDHVKGAAPVLEFPAQLQVGPYEAMAWLRGTDSRVLQPSPAQGQLFEAGSSKLQLVIGAGALQSFQDPRNPPDLSDWEAHTSYEPDVNWEQAEVRLTPGYDGMEAPVRTYRVRAVGIQEAGQDGSADPYIYLPLDAARRILAENRPAAREMGLAEGTLAYVRTEGMEFTEEVMEQISQMGFTVQSEVSYIQAMTEALRRQQGQLLAIGVISLAVSAIGIANTMYASVLERRREIGIMKVIGMEPREIRGLFLAQAGIIGVSGGLLGLAASLVAVLVMNLGNGSSEAAAGSHGITIPLPVAAFALGIAAATSVLAGLYPAWRATAMRPLEAIRSRT